MKMYKVTCKCGHVGRENYLPVDYPVYAYNGREAAFKARFIPRVKHDHKDAILDVKEINYDEFELLEEKNKNDEYLKCKCIQDQNCLDLSDRLCQETKKDREFKPHDVDTVYYKKQKIKNPRKYFKILAMMNKYDMEDAVC